LFKTITTHKQYCKNTSWDCERGFPAQDIHRYCNNGWEEDGYYNDSYKAATKFIKDRDPAYSGYIQE
jgi:hypothetical protein